MNIYTIMVHGAKGSAFRTGTINQLMEMYYSNIDNTLYDIVGVQANLNKMQLFEELNRLI